MNNATATNAMALALAKTGLVNAAQLAELAKPAPEPVPTCQYCGKPAALVTGKAIYPRLSYLHSKKFWQCEPCEAYVGCHEPNIGYGDGTRPLGLLANAELRDAKKSVHAVFDPIWQEKSGKSRRQAYQWLAEKMGIPVAECHVGCFSIEQCTRARAICLDYLA